MRKFGTVLYGVAIWAATTAIEDLVYQSSDLRQRTGGPVAPSLSLPMVRG
jgi:hypothetical protein